MSAPIEYVLRTGAAFAVAWLLSRVLRRAPAALRHLIWVCAFGMVAAAPLLLRFGPPIRIPERAQPAIAAAAMAPDSAAVFHAQPGPRRGGTIPVLQILWIAGMLAFAARYARSAAKVRALVRRSSPVRDLPEIEALAAPVRIAVSDTVGTALTIGAFRPRIVLPRECEQWEPARLRAVLLHELAHVRRRDCLSQWLANLVCAVHWFNPLAWLARSEMQCESERACDDAVIRAGVEGGTFARQLLEMAQSMNSQGGSLVSMAVTTKLERRIARLLDPRADRRPLSFTRTALGAAAALLLLIPTAGLRAEKVFPAPAPQPVPRGPAAVRPQPAPLPVAAVHRRAPIAAQVAQTASPQETGSLSGVVTDPTGAVVAGATVRIAGAATSFSTKSDALGRWSFSGLPNGSYSLDVQVPGFRTYSRRAVSVQAGVTTESNARLMLGQMSESLTVTAPAPNPAPAPLAAASSKPTRVSAGVEAARLLHRVEPLYPDDARAQGLQGPVTLQALIDKAGFVSNPRLVSLDSPPALVQAAIDAIKQWQFEPTRLNGEPVEILTEITVNFTLQ